MAILCGMVFRLCSMDPSRLLTWLRQERKSLSLSVQAGEEGRLPVSAPGYLPDFVESPPPREEPSAAAVLPVFSAEGEVPVTYRCQLQPDVRNLLEKPLVWNLRQEEPTVLILHTHSTESYTKGEERYVETADYRTLEEDFNMLSIGAYTAQLLSTQGIPTVQDRQIHDYPSYNGAYVDARADIEAYLKTYPSIRLILDLHRDAEEGEQEGDTVSTDTGDAARLMVVIGANHPEYEENLSIGLKLQAQLESQVPGITRPLQLRASRFNQDLSAGALLIEVGSAGNTRQEALRAARQLARAVAALGQGTQAPAREA